MRNDPQGREPRAPAIAIWAVTGMFVGIAVTVILGAFPVWVIIGAGLGTAFGFFTTRTRDLPTDDY